jgi:hypothetical protein
MADAPIEAALPLEPEDAQAAANKAPAIAVSDPRRLRTRVSMGGLGKRRDTTPDLIRAPWVDAGRRRFM